MQRIKGRRIKGAIIAGISWFKHFKKSVDNANVFPVPDGDTGKNMNFAFQAAMNEIEKVVGNNASDVAWAAARGTLMGGRGCSGMILSGFFSGFAEAVGDRSVLTGYDLARAFQVGCMRARERVETPVEGTILTVGEGAAKAALKEAQKTNQLNQIIISALKGAKAALERTPKQLSVLKEHAVVDAGGMGLVYFLEGMVRFINRQPVDALAALAIPQLEKASITGANVTLSEYKYCTEIRIRLIGHSQKQLHEFLKSQGEDLMIAQTEDGLCKIHVHLKDPGSILEIIKKYGELTWQKIDDMEKQHDHAFGTN